MSMVVLRVQKLEVVVIHIPENIFNKISFIVGSPNRVSNTPTIVFNDLRINFLSDLSTILLKDTAIRELPDVSTFAFWCRKANLVKLFNDMNDNRLLLGVGLVFHISPSNVPVNFAFSLVFAFLAGNSSVVRLPSKESASASAIIEALLKLLKIAKYSKLAPFINLIKFEHDDDINKFWLSVADARVIWGGDKTVDYMRSFKSKPKSREVTFPDRYSICVMNPTKLLDSSDTEFKALCINLFNDIYLMDKHACTSPQLLVWVGSNSDIKYAKEKFWPKFFEYVQKKYTIEPIHVMDKYVDACKNILTNDNVKKIKKQKNLIYNIELSHLQDRQQYQRGYFGTIHEVSIESLDSMSKIINSRFQTLTYYGFTVRTMRKFVENNNLRGIDRIVPVGRSLEMGVIWDGYNVVQHLSRIVDIK